MDSDGVIYDYEMEPSRNYYMKTSLPKGAIRLLPNMYVRVQVISSYEIMVQLSINKDMSFADEYYHSIPIGTEEQFLFEKGSNYDNKVFALYILDWSEHFGLYTIQSTNCADFIISDFCSRMNIYNLDYEFWTRDGKERFIKELSNTLNEDIDFWDSFEYDPSINLKNIKMQFVIAGSLHDSRKYIFTFVSSPKTSLELDQEEKEISDFFDDMFTDYIVGQQFTPNNFR